MGRGRGKGKGNREVEMGEEERDGYREKDAGEGKVKKQR